MELSNKIDYQSIASRSYDLITRISHMYQPARQRRTRGDCWDEVIHIVSGFQVAGFPHVVRSRWPAGDGDCVQVASLFYSYLFNQSSVLHSEARSVACALQEAVKAIRADDMDMLLNWAQFVHFGV
jgi:hypothetical protein